MKKLLLTVVAVAASVASLSAVAHTTDPVSVTAVQKVFAAGTNAEVIRSVVNDESKRIGSPAQITTAQVQDIITNCSDASAGTCAAFLKAHQHEVLGLAKGTPLSPADVANLSAAYHAQDAADAAAKINNIIAVRSH